MGCRSSTPLDVVELEHRDAQHPLDAFALIDLARWERNQYTIRHRSRGHRNRLSPEERMEDIAALQQSLSAMEDFFQNLVGQAHIYMEAMDPNNALSTAGPPPASGAAIASLIQSPLREKELCQHNKACSICFEEYKAQECVSRLPCGHFYHPSCVEKWLWKHCTCPTCRYEIPTDDPDFEEGRMERMEARKLPLSSQEDNSSDGQLGSTWDESSWGEECVPLMQDFQAFCEDFQYREQVEEDIIWTGDRDSQVHPGCIMRRVGEDDEERPLIVVEEEPLPVIVERRISQNGSATFAPFGTVRSALDENDEASIDSSVTETRV